MPCVVDVHPDRPYARGMAQGGRVTQLPADPAFLDIEAPWAVIQAHAEAHTVASDAVWVSGEVPRVTDFEQGVQGGVRYFEEGEVGWRPEAVSGCWSWR